MAAWSPASTGPRASSGAPPPPPPPHGGGSAGRWGAGSGRRAEPPGVGEPVSYSYTSVAHFPGGHGVYTWESGTGPYPHARGGEVEEPAGSPERPGSRGLLAQERLQRQHREGPQQHFEQHSEQHVPDGLSGEQQRQAARGAALIPGLVAAATAGRSQRGQQQQPQQQRPQPPPPPPPQAGAPAQPAPISLGEYHTGESGSGKRWFYVTRG